jgi:hypothetical protein
LYSSSSVVLRRPLRLHGDVQKDLAWETGLLLLGEGRLLAVAEGKQLL